MQVSFYKLYATSILALKRNIENSVSTLFDRCKIYTLFYASGKQYSKLKKKKEYIYIFVILTIEKWLISFEQIYIFIEFL